MFVPPWLSAWTEMGLRRIKPILAGVLPGDKLAYSVFSAGRLFPLVQQKLQMIPFIRH
ncbi:hypothetical protein BN871_AV_00250 [Paenibacillus sp. P22]|nr:hypothetical protein BN871_AV_00250 [Paenibacillus sp. P22]